MNHELKAIELMTRRGYTVLKTKDSSVGADHKVILMWTDKGNYVYRYCKDPVPVMTHVWACMVWSKYHLPKILFKAKNCSIETMTPGTTMEHGKLTRTQQIRVMKTVGKLLREMHKVKTKRYGYLIKPGVGQVNSWKKYILRLALRKLDSISKVISKETYNKTKKFVIDNAFEYHNPVLIHKDISADNMMVYKGKFSGIIDAADALSGDPMYEIAIVRDRFRKPGMKYEYLVSALEKSYGKIDEKKVQYYFMVHTISRIYWDNKYKRKRMIFYVKRLEEMIGEPSF